MLYPVTAYFVLRKMPVLKRDRQECKYVRTHKIRPHASHRHGGTSVLQYQTYSPCENWINVPAWSCVSLNVRVSSEEVDEGGGDGMQEGRCRRGRLWDSRRERVSNTKLGVSELFCSVRPAQPDSS